MLFPKMNAKRAVYSLNGVWNFGVIDENYQPIRKNNTLSKMAVPASMNEIVTDDKVKEHVGKVLYEREFSVPYQEDKIYRLRIGATSHKCVVYLNGERIGESLSGFYPIDLHLENLQAVNRLSVVIDNRLDFQCLPVGKMEDGKQIINHDFYNYTGIHRDVVVYTLPKKHIEDIVIETVVQGDYSKVKATALGNFERVEFNVYDMENNLVATSTDGNITVAEPKLWSCESPYLYTLCVKTEEDYYEERFGIRKVEVKGVQFMLNDKPVYFKGFGLHEDFIVTGKGNNTAVNIRNFELLKWINANSFRTSHYPYAEELMELADEYGFLVVDEVPAVCMKWWKEGNFGKNTVNDETKALHKKLIHDLIARDKNHPCVVMWSLANEPESGEDGAVSYFEDIFAYARTLTHLPLTFVNCAFFGECKCSHLPDVLCLNRYYGWYENHGDLATIQPKLSKELQEFYDVYKKPIILSEFGADTVEGLHALPAESFSEEFQVEYLRENCQVLDDYDFCIGEHPWAFADFKTKQGLTRVRGNRKGVFTKDRQPKMSAYYLKERWRKNKNVGE